MNSDDYKILALMFLIAVLCWVGGTLTEASKYELPEEIEAISGDFTHPDTLIVFKSNKTFHFQFK